MGGKSLMKKLIIFTLLLSLSCNAELSIGQIDNMVLKIQKKRVSKMDIDYKTVPSPFIVIKKDKDSNTTIVKSPTHKISFDLSAIINNSAFINGRWYKVGDMMNDYNVTNISGSEVKLQKGKSVIELFLPNKPVKIPQIQIK